MISRTRTHRCDCEFCDQHDLEIPLEPWEIRQLEEQLAQEMAWSIEAEINRWTPARNMAERLRRDVEAATVRMSNEVERQLFGLQTVRIHNPDGTVTVLE